MKHQQVLALKELYEPEFNKVNLERNTNGKGASKKIELEFEIKKLHSVITEMDSGKNAKQESILK